MVDPFELPVSKKKEEEVSLDSKLFDLDSHSSRLPTSTHSFLLPSSSDEKVDDP